MKSAMMKIWMLALLPFVIMNAPLCAQAFFLPDTGQTACYGDKGKIKAITCPSPDQPLAQDGSYSMYPPSFTVNGDATVTDNNTFLIWQQGIGNLYGTWDQAFAYCANLTFAGHTDWRLPSRNELASIVDYGKFDPALNASIFTQSGSINHWSSSQDSTGAWMINFGNGAIQHQSKSVGAYPKCVRGDMKLGDLWDNGDGTLSDGASGLTLQWTAGGQMKWGAALTYCENLTLAGNTDWRAPNIKELESFTENGSISGYFTNGDYWTSTTNAGNFDYSWAVSLPGGGSTVKLKGDLDKRVICVRGQKAGPLDYQEISVEPSGLDFGYIGMNESKESTLTVANRGKAALVVGNIVLPSFPFSVTADGCSGRILQGWDSCVITAEFAATSEGIHTGTITIPSNDADNQNLKISLWATVTLLPGRGYLMPDTGQTRCFSSDGWNINCPTPGGPLAQDGSYTINPMSFTNNADGTVTDNNTFSMWQRDDDGIRRTRDDAKTYCENLTLGGYTGWRLPTWKEKVLITNYNYTFGALSLSGFPGSAGKSYVTLDSSSSPNYVDYVKCVRGGRLPYGPFVDNGNDTVTDSATGLMWQRKGEVNGAWDAVINACEALSLGGYTDWRLPNYKELLSLTDSTRYDPVVDLIFFPTVYQNGVDYWTSTNTLYAAAYTSRYDEVYTISFRTGGFGTPGGDYIDANYSNNSRCVRGGNAFPAMLIGEVVDAATGGPVFGVSVTVTDLSTMHSTTTNADGIYSVTGITPGALTASFEKSGYFPQTISATVTSGQTLTSNVQMISIPPLAVAITSPQNGTVVSEATIEVTGTVNNNASVTINGSGVTVSNGSFSATIFLHEGQNPIMAFATDQYGQTASQSITVTLTPRLDAWEIFVNPLAADFHQVTVGGSSTYGIVISNGGSGSLVIGNIGAPHAPFSISYDQCSGHTLSASTTCWIGVRFLPTVEGIFSGALTIPSNDADNPLATVTLSGTGQTFADAHFLQDTGQETCYNSTGAVMTCPAPGISSAQDGSYLMNPPAFTINGNGTVTDANTGLQWQQQNDSLKRTWTNAGAYCTNLALGGHSDWRIPSKVELVGLADYGANQPAIDSITFPNTYADNYWTSTTSINNAWYVNFTEGTASQTPQSSTAYVRCVRGTPLSSGIWQDNYDGTISDLATGLMWMQTELASTMDWSSALSVCEGAVYAGYADWRLPNIKELVTNDGTCSQWSSTTRTSSPGQAFAMNSCDEVVSFFAKSVTDRHVQCVRGENINTPPVPPAISNVTVINTALDSATITWTTDQFADSRVDYGTTASYGSSVADQTAITSHSIVLTGLSPETIYHFKVTSTNSRGLTSSSADSTLNTIGPPTISSVATGNTTTNSATITWTTDQPTDSLVSYGTTTSYGSTVGDPAMTTNHSVTLMNLNTQTKYHFSVTSRNSYNITASSGDNTFTTTTPITITIASPAEGAAIFRPDATVKGSIVNTAGNETGVTVNGIVATIYGNEFEANHVPLAEGTNTITVTATDTSGYTATSSVTVTGSTSGRVITLTPTVASGIAPLDVTLKIDGSFTITNSDVSYTGPGSVEYLPGDAIDAWAVRITTEGVYSFTAEVTDDQNNTYTDTVEVVVQNKTALDVLLKAKWEGMKNKLASQDIANAVTYFNSGSQQLYNDLFTALNAQLPQLVQEMQDIQLIYVRNGTAKYRIIKNEIYGGQALAITYYIYFALDDRGLWKIVKF